MAYITDSNLPAPHANTYQSLKMCEAFSACGCELTMHHPLRYYSIAMRGQMPNYWEDIGLDNPPFAIRPIPTADPEWLRSIGMGRLVDWMNGHRWFDRICYYAIYGSFTIAVALYILWQQKRFDIIYTRSDCSLLALVRLKRWLRIPIIYEMHTFKDGTRKMPLLSRVDQIVSIASEMKLLLIARNVPGDRIIVAPNGVDLEQFEIRQEKNECRRRLGLPLDHFIVGYVGRFQTTRMEKGIPELVRAIAQLGTETGQSAPLLVCVGGPMRVVPPYLDLVRQLGIRRERVTFIDHVPSREIPLWLGAFDVAVAPFPNSEHYSYFMSPLKLFEYMAAGVPIVATDLPSIRGVLRHGENAWLVKPGDPASLAQGILAIRKDPALGKRLAEQAQEDVQQNTWIKRAMYIVQKVQSGAS
jgi:glycosyltransferase involved in cell wall biosynthesis